MPVQTLSHKLPADCKNIAGQNQCRPGGDDQALYVVIFSTETETAGEASDNANNQRHSEQGSSNALPIEDRK